MAYKYYSKNKGGSLCSGYGVFPDGKKCKGCSDCKGKPMTLGQIKAHIGSRVVTVRKGDTLDTILAKVEKKQTKLLKKSKR